MDIRCTNCGNTDFVPASIGEVSSVDGCMFVPTVNIYSCTKCGHIEMYVRHLDKRALHEKAKRDEKIQNEKDECMKEMNEIEKEIARLTEVIGSDDSIVREVKEANKKLPELKAELQKLKYKYSGICRQSTY